MLLFGSRNARCYAMKKVVPLKTSEDNVLYVEIDQDSDVVPLAPGTRRDDLKDLPPGAEPTSAVSTALEAMTSLQTGLRDIVKNIKDAIEDSGPTAWKVEISIGFKGKTSPIPVILSSEADAALRLSIEWKQKPAAT